MFPLRTFIPSVSLALLLTAVPAVAQSTVNLAWDPSTSTQPAPDGYLIRWGTRLGVYTSSLDVGNRTTWTVSNLETDQRYYFTVLAYSGTGASRVYSDPSNETSNNALITSEAGTLRDDRPSLFWRNDTTGQLMTWHLSGVNVIDTRALSIDRVADLGWRIRGTGDVNGDGFTDLVWRHETAGWLAVWHLRNNQVLSTELLSIDKMTDPLWRLAGVGDVDGDGYADLIWQHDAGWLGLWRLRGSKVVETRFLSIDRVADPRWKIAAVADINRDGYADLLWRHDVDGWLATWLMRGATVVATQALSVDRVADLNWEIKAAGSVDGSGVPSIVWRHRTQGLVALWNLNGSRVTMTSVTKPDRVEDANWVIVGSR